MRRCHGFLLLIAGTAAAQTAPPAAVMPMPVPQSIADWARGAQLFEGLGATHRQVTTTSPEAQRYFDQGLRLMWAFNHDESTRSFARATELDPGCAICFWGVSLTVGPNYNLPFLVNERAKVARDALLAAQRQFSHASPVERALITALAQRYTTAQALDPVALHPFLLAYADAMAKVARRFPADLDVQTLYAEALMNLNAWKLWKPNGKPALGTEKIIATLEAVLKRDPSHPGANHYYIHTMEASPHPEVALGSAGVVGAAMPAAGHLVHMPAHILQRVGNYEGAAEANRRAAIADRAYEAKTHPPDYYPMGYTAHNYQFLAYSAAMEGRKAETLEAVENSRAVVTDGMLRAMPGMDWYVAERYAARVRFGLWDDILAMPAPDAAFPGLMGGYRHARAVAYAAKGRLPEAAAEIAALESLARSVPEDLGAGQNLLRDVLGVALLTARAHAEHASNHIEESLALWRQAVAAEDKLAYDEPKNWFFPVRHELGAALLKFGRPAEAEQVYREDLHQNPGNGWALVGLKSALEAQKKLDEAARTAIEFETAWRHADIQITASSLWPGP